jgi:hypothetical protein
MVQQTKAKGFADDDAQNSPASPRCGGRHGRDADRNPAPHRVRWGARTSARCDMYRQLSLFGDVFERVRADYVEKPDDSKLIESAINGMLAGLEERILLIDRSIYRR